MVTMVVRRAAVDTDHPVGTLCPQPKLPRRAKGGASYLSSLLAYAGPAATRPQTPTSFTRRTLLSLRLRQP